MKGQKNQASQKKNNKRYILAVDDDPDIAKFIERASSRQGLKVSAFTDPAMALKDFRDSLKEYLGDQPLVYIKKGLTNYAKMGKKGLSVLADLGAYPYKSKYKDLVDYELSLPTKYNVPMKGFCLYHQKDFDNLSDEQKQKLIEHHGEALKIMEA